MPEQEEAVVIESNEDGQIPQVAAEPEVDANDEEVAPEPEATTEQMTVPQIEQEEE